MKNFSKNLTEVDRLLDEGQAIKCPECQDLFLGLPEQILCDDCTKAQGRDKNFHKRFFVLLGIIYSLMPSGFQKQVSKHDFYKYVKKGKGETRSTKFDEMNQDEFVVFVREFVNFIYPNVLGFYWDLENLERIKAQIEKEFKTLINPTT